MVTLFGAQNTGVAGETEKRLQEQLTCWGSRGRTFSRVKERGDRGGSLLSHVGPAIYLGFIPQAAREWTWRDTPTNRSGSEPEPHGMLAKKSTREAAGKERGSVGRTVMVCSVGRPSLLRPQGKSVNCQCCGGGVGGNARSLSPAWSISSLAFSRGYHKNYLLSAIICNMI